MIEEENNRYDFEVIFATENQVHRARYKTYSPKDYDRVVRMFMSDFRDVSYIIKSVRLKGKDD